MGNAEYALIFDMDSDAAIKCITVVYNHYIGKPILNQWEQKIKYEGKHIRLKSSDYDQYLLIQDLPFDQIISYFLSGENHV